MPSLGEYLGLTDEQVKAICDSDGKLQKDAPDIKKFLLDHLFELTEEPMGARVDNFGWVGSDLVVHLAIPSDKFRTKMQIITSRKPRK